MPYTLFPCGANKKPLIKDWPNQATKDPSQIELWKQLFKDRLTYWGIPCGKDNGLYMLDVDVKDDNGFETLKTLPVPPTMSQPTPSGGKHYVFRYPNDGKEYRNKVKFLPGLDIRGEGGYMLYYGADQTPIADPPSWLLKQGLSPTYEVTGSTIKIDPTIAEGIIKKSIETIQDAAEGERNHTLNCESFRIGQLVASGSITREYAESVLMDATKNILKPYEARATINSGLNGGFSKPMTSPFTEPVPVFSIPPPPTIAKWTPPKLNASDLFNGST